jgi:hypothetical protein
MAPVEPSRPGRIQLDKKWHFVSELLGWDLTFTKSRS